MIKKLDIISKNEKTAYRLPAFKYMPQEIINSQIVMNDFDDSEVEEEGRSKFSEPNSFKKRGRPRISRASFPLATADLRSTGSGFVYTKEEI